MAAMRWILITVLGISAVGVPAAFPAVGQTVLSNPADLITSRAADEVAGIKMAFLYEPAWRLSLVDEAVDVSQSQDIAVYRST
jgi:hypothetical protein